MELNTYWSDAANWTISAGVEPPKASTLHPFIAYIKNRTVIVADLGDVGMVHEARWKLEQWLNKISGEMGYRIMIAALVDPAMKDGLNTELVLYARESKLDIKWDAEWKG